MKALFTIVLTCITIFSMAQSANNAVKVEYAGYRTSPKTGYYVKITNLQDCKADVQIQYKGNYDYANINKNGSTYYYVGTQATAFEIKVRALTDCGCGDNSWVTFKLTSAPVTFTNAHFERSATDKYRGYIVFTTEQQSNVNRFNVRFSLDNKNKITVGFLVPDDLNPNTTYRYPVDLKPIVQRLQNQAAN